MDTKGEVKVKVKGMVTTDGRQRKEAGRGHVLTLDKRAASEVGNRIV
jgi:hypothetical protein